MHIGRSPVGTKGIVGAMNTTTIQENPLKSQMLVPCLWPRLTGANKGCYATVEAPVCQYKIQLDIRPGGV